MQDPNTNNILPAHTPLNKVISSQNDDLLGYGLQHVLVLCVVDLFGNKIFKGNIFGVDLLNKLHLSTQSYICQSLIPYS